MFVLSSRSCYFCICRHQQSVQAPDKYSRVSWKEWKRGFSHWLAAVHSFYSTDGVCICKYKEPSKSVSAAATEKLSSGSGSLLSRSPSSAPGTQPVQERQQLLVQNRAVNRAPESAINAGDVVRGRSPQRRPRTSPLAAASTGRSPSQVNGGPESGATSFDSGPSTSTFGHVSRSSAASCIARK